MNEERIIEQMIAFIEEKEKDAMRDKMQSGTSKRNDIVNSIIEKLESELENEN